MSKTWKKRQREESCVKVQVVWLTSTEDRMGLNILSNDCKQWITLFSVFVSLFLDNIAAVPIERKVSYVG